MGMLLDDSFVSIMMMMMEIVGIIGI